jgi:hypothetical protein
MPTARKLSCEQANEMKYVRHAWHVLMGLLYLAIVVGVLSVASTRFETLVSAGIVLVYSALLHNASVLGTAIDVNNYAAFARFRVLSAHHGLTEGEEGPFLEQENALADGLKKRNGVILIRQLSNAAVSLYALFKVVEAIL